MIQKKAARSGRLQLETLRLERLSARFAVLVDCDRAPRRRAQLRMVLHPAKLVGHVPIIGRGTARHILAALDVLRVSAAADIRSDRRTTHRPDTGRDVTAASAADLVAKHTTDNAADDGARDIRSASDTLAVNPAALIGRSHDGVDGSHVGLVQTLTRTLLVGISGRRLVGRRRLVRLVFGHPITAY